MTTPQPASTEWDRKCLEWVWQASPHNKQRIIDSALEKFKAETERKVREAKVEVAQRILRTVQAGLPMRLTQDAINAIISENSKEEKGLEN